MTTPSYADYSAWAKLDRNTKEYAIAAISRLNDRRTGRDRDDAWINYAVRQWEQQIAELSAE